MTWSCIGLVGAGEAYLAALVRGEFDESEVSVVFATLIKAGLRAPSG